MGLGDKIQDWVATVTATSSVIGALSVYDLVQRVALRFSEDARQRAVVRMAYAVNRAVQLSGAKLVVRGLENINFTRNYIVVANHQSFFDIAMTMECLGPLFPRYVSKRELARGVPGISYNLRHSGSALIDRRDPRQSIREIDRLATHVREDGWSVVIFPEGTRSKTGAMRRFQPAGIRTFCLKAPGVPILPLTLSGGSKLFSKNLRPVVRNVTFIFQAHPPVIPPAASDSRAFAAFIAELQETIRVALPENERDLPLMEFEAPPR